MPSRQSAQVEAFCDWRELRCAAAENVGVNELAVSVNEVLGDRGRGEGRPADGHHAITRLVTEPALVDRAQNAHR